MSSIDGRPDILLVSGKYFDYLHPENNEYTIFDIAHHLSMLCRFAGAVLKFFSVAQHSFIVSRLCPPELALPGLLHDMAEMALVDLPRPLKYICPDYRRIEERVEFPMFRKFGLSYPMDPEVKKADRMALWIEQRDLMPIHQDHWTGFEELDLEAIQRHPTIVPLGPEDARDLFIGEYNRLTNGSLG